MKKLLVAVLFLQAAASPRGSIEGIVMKAGTALQQSLPHARLELREGPGTLIVVRSDAGGRFVFSNLAAGRYRLFLTEDGFIRQEYGQRFPNMPGLPINVTAGQHVTNISFRPDAAPTIAGTVLDGNGIPIADILVTAARRTYDVRGRPTLTVVASALTDDRGAYRIFWIDPGDYYVNAGSPPLRTSSDTNEPARPAYAPVYFPGVTDPEGIRPIRVDIGREVNGVDFRLRVQGLAQIFGQALHAITRKPVAATITLSPVEESNVARYHGQSSVASGAFVIGDGVAPGSYIVVGRSDSLEKLTGFTRIRVPSLPGFFLNVRLLLSPGIRVNGRMMGIAQSLPDLRRSHITLTSVEPGVPSPARMSPTADGAFSIMDAIPGEYLLTVSDLPDDLYVKAVRHGVEDILESAIAVATESTAPLQILLGSDGGRITAAILRRDGRPAVGAQVVLVPDSARRNQPDQYRLGTTGEDGLVTMRGIPPGGYKLFAWETIEPNAYRNQDYMRTYDSLGLSILIGPGENRAVEARVISGEQ